MFLWTWKSSGRRKEAFNRAKSVRRRASPGQPNRPLHAGSAVFCYGDTMEIRACPQNGRERLRQGVRTRNARRTRQLSPTTYPPGGHSRELPQGMRRQGPTRPHDFRVELQGRPTGHSRGVRRVAGGWLSLRRDRTGRDNPRHAPGKVGSWLRRRDSFRVPAARNRLIHRLEPAPPADHKARFID